MAKKKTKIEPDKKVEEEKLEIAKVTFSFTFTRDEAEHYINKPKSQITRNLKKYMCSIFEAAAKKMLETSPDEIVKNCKVEVPDELK